VSILTPTVAAGAKKSLFWAGALAFLLLFAIGSLLLTGAATETDPLSPENPAPDGTMAVYEVLRDRGVAVETTETLEATTAAVRDPATTTLLVYDPENYLDDDQWGSLLGLAGHLVVLEPGTRALQAIAPGVSPAGVTDDDPLEAGCALPAAAAAGSVSPAALPTAPARRPAMSMPASAATATGRTTRTRSSGCPMAAPPSRLSARRRR